MNLVQLRYFVAVARSKSLSRAAAELHVSQPAITRQLKLLEAELEAVLLSRQHRGVELTDAGRLFFERAAFQIQSFDQLLLEFKDLSFAPSGRIRIGCPPSLTRQIIAGPLQAFLTRYPKVTVEVRESISDALASAVIADQLDIAVVSTIATQPHLSRELLFEEPIWLFGPANERPRKVMLRDLARHALLMTRRNNAVRDMIEREMLDLSLRPNIVVETDSSQLIELLVKRGLGYAAAPYFTFREEVKLKKLSGAPIERLTIDRWLIRRKDRPVTGAVQEFLKLLRAAIAQTLGDISPLLTSARKTSARAVGAASRAEKR